MHIPQNVFVGADDLYVFGKSMSEVFNQNIERVVDCFFYQYYHYFIEDRCRCCGGEDW